MVLIGGIIMFELLYKLSQGYPDVLKFVFEVLAIDRKYLFIMERLGIFGRQLRFLWEDSCQANMDKFIRLLEKFDNGELSQTYIKKHVRKTRGLDIEV